MKGIQNDIKVALEPSESEVIKTPMDSIECIHIVDFIMSERNLKRELRVNRSTFLIALIIATSGGSNVWRMVNSIHVGYQTFYESIQTLKDKGLIVMIPQGRTKMYYPTRKLVEVVKKNYQEIQKLGKKRVKSSKPNKS